MESSIFKKLQAKRVHSNSTLASIKAQKSALVCLMPFFYYTAGAYSFPIRMGKRHETHFLLSLRLLEEGHELYPSLYGRREQIRKCNGQEHPREI